MSCIERTEIPRGLNDDLVRKLALLHGAPPGIAESTIALLGFGTRALLAGSSPPLIEMTDDRPVRITITAAGAKVIEACARFVEHADESDWENRVPDEDSWSVNHEEKLGRVIDVLQDSGVMDTVG
jgi:hypothetical protein